MSLTEFLFACVAIGSFLRLVMRDTGPFESLKKFRKLLGHPTGDFDDEVDESSLPELAKMVKCINCFSFNTSLVVTIAFYTISGRATRPLDVLVACAMPFALRYGSTLVYYSYYYAEHLQRNTQTSCHIPPSVKAGEHPPKFKKTTQGTVRVR